MQPAWFLRATHGSAAGELVRSVDWSATPLGPPDRWPTTLRTTVELCLSTRFPVLITWGPDLTMIYNDGYRGMIGTKHPGAMGSPAHAVWAEIWDEVGPTFDEVLTTGTPSWTEDEPLLIDRSGSLEEAHFTFSYSPLLDDDGRIAGVLDISTETTTQVVERRRMELLASLANGIQDVDGDLAALGRVAAEVLRRSTADVAAADLYLRPSPDQTYLLATTRPAGDEDAVPQDVVEEVARTGVSLERGRTLVAPLLAAGEEAAGVVVLQAGSRRPVDHHYRQFLAFLASTLGSAVGATLRRAREVGLLREVSDALQQSMLPRGEGVVGVATRYQSATGHLAVGGDWYDVVELSPGCRALVVGDCVGHGLHAATVMGQLRTATRTLLLEGNGPAAALARLDEFARRLPGAACTTVFCAVVDEAAETLTYARAGHVPPLLVTSGERWLLPDGGPPLTVASAPRRESTVDLPPDATLVLYTDGLVERRGEHLRTGLARLADALREVLADPTTTSGTASPTELVADRLLDLLVPDGSDDDLALVVYRAQPAADRAPAVPSGV